MPSAQLPYAVPLLARLPGVPVWVVADCGDSKKTAPSFPGVLCLTAAAAWIWR
jgi:hypothetical protein